MATSCEGGDHGPAQGRARGVGERFRETPGGKVLRISPSTGGNLLGNHSRGTGRPRARVRVSGGDGRASAWARLTVGGLRALHPLELLAQVLGRLPDREASPVALRAGPVRRLPAEPFR